MIYQALAELAEREQLVDDPAFEPKEVAYFIHLGPDGKYLGVSAPRAEIPAKGKGAPKLRPPTVRIPRRSDRTSGDKAEFLVDKAEYVFGIDPTGKRSVAKLAIRRCLFRDSVVTAHSALKKDSLASLISFLETDAPDEIRALLGPEKEAEAKARAGELFAFVYDPEGGVASIHDDPAIGAWFSATLGSEGEDIRGTCLVTGEANAPLTRLHGKPKGIPPKGKTKGGVPLTSVNAEAFKSYRLEDIGCAPISKRANVLIETALNRLLDSAYQKPDGSKCETRHVQLSDDTVIVYWSRGDSELGWFEELDRHSPEQIAALLRSPHGNRAAPIEDPSQFYALILSGMQGRAIVRSFLQGTVASVALAIEAYREQVRITLPYGEPPGSFGLRDYRLTLVPRRDLDRLPPELASDLYLAIVFNRDFSLSVLQTLVSRMRVELLPKRDRGTGRDEMILAARCSLLKAWFIRNRKENITVSLDSNRTDPPYRLGRLFAVVDKLQQDALGTVNATIVDRYYGSASSTPQAVFPTLLRRSQHHLGKLRRENPGLAVNTERLLQQIVSDLSRFPQTMTLEQQGLFALGFYHQRQAFFTRRTEKEKENSR